jgi:GNAT superfamily N-acetyltransferase
VRRSSRGRPSSPPVASDEYVVRPARSSDLPLLPAIEQAAAGLFADYGLSAALASALTSPADFRRGFEQECLWVAAGGDGAPVGFALATVVGANAHLDELDVLPAHGQRGLGRALVAAFLDWARAQSLPAATLTTLRHVPWNAPFYQRMGFRVLEPAELTTELRELLAAEIARGLPAEGRVAMRRELAD